MVGVPAFVRAWVSRSRMVSALARAGNR